jgi:hypothetical protein
VLQWGEDEIGITATSLLAQARTDSELRQMQARLPLWSELPSNLNWRPIQREMPAALVWCRYAIASTIYLPTNSDLKLHRKRS